MEVKNKATGFMSMGAEGQRCISSVGNWGDYYFGERNDVNRPHGRCIKIDNHGDICLGYYKNGRVTVGNTIDIRSDGSIYVGESWYDDNGVLRSRWTRYF